MIDIDSTIFIAFLIVNLVLGLFASRGVKTIRGFAVGDKTFSTATLVSTIVATWISGEFFLTIIIESYNSGIFFISLIFIDFIGLLLVGILFAPRMSEFLGKLSIAEAMGDLYGKNVRVVTSIAGFLAVSGIISIQLKIAGTLFEYALGINAMYGVILSGIIITFYSSLGGIKSVTFTDVIQFIFFSIMIPAIAYFLLKNIENEKVLNTLTTNSLFDYRSVFTFDNPQIYYYLSLVVWSLIPSFNPAIFQRVAMAKSAGQASQSFIITSMITLFFAIILCWIGVLILYITPNIKGDDALILFFLDYGWVFGFRGVILVGIMAMVMSTIDSYINSSSVLVTHDLKEAFNIKFIKNKLFATRVCSFFIGIISILFAMYEGGLLQLFLWTSTFYIPIVTVPFIMSVFGFHSTGRSVLAGMIAGFTVTVLWELLLKREMGNVGGLIPGMLANLVVLMSYHYIFNQPGGWVGIKDNSYLEEQKLIRRRRWNKLVEGIHNFNFITYCKSYIPNQDSVYIYFAGFCMIVTYATMFLTPSFELLQDQIVMFSYASVLLISIGFIIVATFWSEVKKKGSLQHCGC